VWVETIPGVGGLVGFAEAVGEEFVLVVAPGVAVAGAIITGAGIANSGGVGEEIITS
jgi:hypothetical protein